jgi:predicted RND superfamily exporter protein
MPILEYDEMALSNDAMTKATILALVGVCIIFMAGFGSMRHPLLAMFALMIAFAWTMGYITLAVGHLNILSIAFGAMLIGLGTDFSVHYLGRYLDLRRSGWDVVESLCQTVNSSDPVLLPVRSRLRQHFTPPRLQNSRALPNWEKLPAAGFSSVRFRRSPFFPR